jgi:hypothetical protein
MYINHKTDRVHHACDPIIFTGPFVGSWGHLFHFHIPIVNRLREEYPEAFIVSAGYAGDDFYYKNDRGESTIDAYLAYPTNPDIRRVYGLHQADYGDIQQARSVAEKRFRHIDIDHSNPPTDHEWMRMVERMKRTHYRLGSFAEPSPEYLLQTQDGKDYVILHSKNSKPLRSRDPRGEGIANADYEFDKEFVTQLAKHVKVFVIGIPDECNTFEGDNIVDLTHLSAQERPEVLLPLTENARAMVSTSSASTINYALSVGCPSICYASRRDKGNHDGKYNYYGVPTNHHVLMEFDVSKRVENTIDWLYELENLPRYTHEVVRIDEHMGRWI